MVFTSLEFILFFLPTCLAGYYLLPNRTGIRNAWLLLASLFFYAWGEPVFVFVMLVSIILNWIMALFVFGRIGVLALAVGMNLSILFVFKYLNFVTGGFTDIALPIGISFFTFQALSYVIDVYRGEPARRGLLDVALYIALFPQLVAGPIVRWTTICSQLVNRHVSTVMFADGVQRFLIGFNKKVLLANVFAETADRVFALSSPDASLAWLGALSYSLQIFFDFSGYSDMAIGLGKLFGFEFPENFNYPYLSNSASEFWRRWHMTLGSWFRDYVYFPLGGSRTDSKWILIRNLAVVWLLTGIWHGANWTFIIWGGLWGVCIIGEKLTGRRLSWPLTMLTMIFGWVLFRSSDVASALRYMAAMFGVAGSVSPMAVFEWNELLVPLSVGLLCVTPLFRRVAMTVPMLVLQMMLFAVSVCRLSMNAYNPFIYFNF